MANSPLQKIVTASAGRGAQLELGVGNNQYARASDFNPVVDYVNDRASENVTTATGSSVTINAPIGRVTTGTLTTAAVTAGAYATTTITVTDSYVTANSLIRVTLESYSGTLNTNGVPAIYRVTPAAGSFTVLITNLHGTNALNGTVTLSFQLF